MRPRAWASVLLAAALSAAGCSGDDTTNGGSPPDGSVADAAPSPDGPPPPAEGSVPVDGAHPGDSASSDGPSTSGNDWPTYQHDPQRSGVAPGETALSKATVPGLKQKWKLSTGSTIESSASVAGGTVYIGSWDGNEYALDAASGTVVWKKNLGTATVQLNCNPPYSSIMGVTASATVQNGVVYTAGGDNNLYALDAATGATLWSVSTIPAGDTQTDKTGFYTFSSPLVAGNYAYYGVGSGGNCPSVQGAMLQIDLAQHKVVSTFFDVPSGYLGAAIWGSPTIDAAGKTIYYGTGNCNGTLADGAAACPAQGSYTDALVALDVSTPGSMTFKAAFLLPSQPASSDWDFGSTPTMFDDGNGRALVGSACKDGNFYAVDASTMKLVWQTQLTSTNGGNPVAGDGSISPAAFHAGALYVAAGNGPDAGFVYSLNPATGKPNWTAPLGGVVMGPVVYANGLVYVGTGSQSSGAKPTVQVLDATTGAVVTSLTGFASSATSPNFISDSITVANGQIFFGLGNGDIYAFGL